MDDFTTKDLLQRALEIVDLIAQNDGTMVQRYKRAIVEGRSMDFDKVLKRERELAFAHYWQIIGSQSSTIQNAKEFITDESETRSIL